VAGRKDSFLGRVWAEERGQTRIGGIASARGMHFHDYTLLGGCHHVVEFSYMLKNEIAYALKEILWLNL
jgi:hypothetical protein